MDTVFDDALDIPYIGFIVTPRNNKIVVFGKGGHNKCLFLFIIVGTESPIAYC